MPLTSSIIFNRHTQQKAKTMKNTKKDKKFSYLEEFKKQMNNPIIQLYKIHLDNLHDCYIEELKKNKFLQEDIINLCVYIFKNCNTLPFPKNLEATKNILKKYDKYFKEANEIIQNERKKCS